MPILRRVLGGSRAQPGRRDRAPERGIQSKALAPPEELAWPWGLTLGLASGISLAGASLLLWAALPQLLAWPWLTAVPMAPWLLSGVLWLHIRRAQGGSAATHGRGPDHAD